MQQGFTTRQIADEVGWKPKTTGTYPSKKWKPFLRKEGKLYYVDGLVENYSLEDYLRLMSQRNDISREPKKPELPELVEQLLMKSRDAAILSVEVYNRPNSHFRTESFLVNITIGWTSLFHAIFENTGVKYFYRDNDGNIEEVDGDAKAWDLSKCVKEYFGSNHSAVHENLKFVVRLRNKVEHRFVPQLDMHVAGECQAALLNYDELICSIFGDYWAIRDCLFVPLQTATLRPGFAVEAQKKFQAENYDLLTEFIDAYRAELPDAIYQDPCYSFRVYLIPKTGNHANSSDIAFEFVKYDPTKPDEMEKLSKMVALIKEKRVPVANQGKYKPSTVAELVSKKIGREFKTHHHTHAWKYYKIRGRGIDPSSCNSQYCQFDEVHNDYVYTDKWVDFLTERISDDTEYQKIINFRDMR